jgi:uncharacterized DUF497 family protein
MQFEWSYEKNLLLIESRGVSFEDALSAIESGGLLSDQPHPNRIKYPSQRMMVVAIRGYAYLLPYVPDGERIFLKTLIPSRKMTKIFLKGD